MPNLLVKDKIITFYGCHGNKNLKVVNSRTGITDYTQLEELFKSKRDQVEADKVIATIGDTGSMNGAGLHFEVRHHPQTFRSSWRILKKG